MSDGLDFSRVPLPRVLLGLLDEIDADVERWALDRAYMVAAGPFLTVAGRAGWPAADRALSFVLAVRRLANLNRPPAGQPERRDRDRANAHYTEQRDELLTWLRGEFPGES